MPIRLHWAEHWKADRRFKNESYQMTTTYTEAEEIQVILGKAHHVVIMQADNPDGDSLGSALALEQILSDMGKEPYLYCGVHIPDYLHHLPGWDRVSDEFPVQFDATLIVDTSADSLFSVFNDSAARSLITKKPCVIIDHHDIEPTIPYATVALVPQAVATGEVIYELAGQLNWPLNIQAKNMLAASIMSDSLGLVSEGTTGRSIHIIAELVDSGVSLAELENNRRELMKKSAELTAYKGQLLQRLEYFADGRICLVHIPWDEIERYSHAYNPSMLVLDEMRLTTGVDVAIAFKTYSAGKITAKIRCNFKKTIAADLAKHFGGGGHPYASGFKIEDGRSYEEIKKECIGIATGLLDAS